MRLSAPTRAPQIPQAAATAFLEALQDSSTLPEVLTHSSASMRVTQTLAAVIIPTLVTTRYPRAPVTTIPFLVPAPVETTPASTTHTSAKIPEPRSERDTITYFLDTWPGFQMSTGATMLLLAPGRGAPILAECRILFLGTTQDRRILMVLTTPSLEAGPASQMKAAVT